MLFSSATPANLGAVVGLSAWVPRPTPVRMRRWWMPVGCRGRGDAAPRRRRRGRRAAGEQRAVVTDSVFSADGSLAPVRCEVCRRRGAASGGQAHGLGVRGGGRGLLYELGLGAPDVVMTCQGAGQPGVVWCSGPTPVQAHLIRCCPAVHLPTQSGAGGN